MAALDWQACSEIIVGHILNGQLEAMAVTVDMLAPPYSKVLYHIKRGIKDPTRLSEIVGLEPIKAVLSAAQETKDIPIDWALLLKRAAARANTGRIMAKVARLLEKGEQVDVSPVLNAIVQMEGEHAQLVRLDKIEPEEHIWMPIGYPPLDYHLGGIMKNFVTVLGGPPGTGKTSLMARIAISAARAKWRVVIFTLEMTNRYLLARMLDMAKLPQTVRRRMWLCEEIVPVDEVVAIASRKAVEGVDLICIDFADLMIEGEETEQKMAAVYKGLQGLSKFLQKPTLLVSQLNRQYRGGIPRMHNLRYSGMAEALCGMVMFAHNPHNVLTDEINERDERIFPTISGRAYLLIAKSKGGYGQYGSPGGIQLKWESKTGWGTDKGVWLPARGVL